MGILQKLGLRKKKNDALPDLNSDLNTALSFDNSPNNPNNPASDLSNAPNNNGLDPNPALNSDFGNEGITKPADNLGMPSFENPQENPSPRLLSDAETLNAQLNSNMQHPAADPLQTPNTPSVQSSEPQARHIGYELNTQPSQSYNTDQPMSGKDIEMINLKLDTIKALLDNLNMRLKTIEKIALEEQERAKRDSW